MERPDTDSTRPLASRIGYIYVRAALRVRQLYSDHLATVGLLPNHHAILSTLNEHGPIHQKLLAERATLDPGDIVSYLDTLQEKKYIDRDRDPSDRRRQIVTITPHGMTALEDADLALDDAETFAFADLTPRQRTQLTKMSATLYDRIANQSPSPAE